MVITPRPFGELLAAAMLSLAAVWRALALPALAISVPVGVLTSLIYATTGGADFLDLLVNDPQSFQTIPDEVFQELARPFYFAVGIAVLLQVLAGVFIALASHRAVATQMSGELVSGREASTEAWRRYPVGLGAFLLVLIGILALTGPAVALWLVPLASVGTPDATSGLVALLLLTVLLGPALWAAVAMSMTTSAVALERGGVIASIRRSAQLVRGRWWATAAFLLLVGLLGGLAIQLIQLVALPLAASGAGGAPLAIATSLGVLAQGLLAAAICAMYTHWYVDLRARRERLTTTDLG